MKVNEKKYQNQPKQCITDATPNKRKKNITINLIRPVKVSYILLSPAVILPERL
jgi:hypothetical protein